MKRKLAPICLIFALLLSACGTAPTSAPDTSAAVETPEVIVSSTPSPEPTPEESNIIYFQYESDVPNQFYDILFPSVSGQEDAEFDCALLVYDCDMFLLPTENDPVTVSSLHKGEHVDVILKTAYTYDEFEFIDVAWYFITAPNGKMGWVKAESLQPCEEEHNESHSAGLMYIRPAYTQGIVIDGCELYQLPGEQAVSQLCKNAYVEIKAATVPENSHEVWLYVFTGITTAESSVYFWVKASEIKQYTRENMYDISSPVSIAPGTGCYWPSGELADVDCSIAYSLMGTESDGTCWLSGFGGMVFHVESIDCLIYPEPIE